MKRYLKHYTVYEDGRVYSSYRNKFLSPDIDHDGYLKVTLTDKTWRVSRLVLTLYNRKPKRGEVCRHIDGDVKNNHISNLCWGSHKENWDDKRKHGRATTGEKHGMAKLTWDQVNQIRASPLKRYGAHFSKKFKVSKELCYQIKANKIWKQKQD